MFDEHYKAVSERWDNLFFNGAIVTGFIFMVWYIIAVSLSVDHPEYFEDGGPDLPPVFEYMAFGILGSAGVMMLVMGLAIAMSYIYRKKAGIL